MGSRKYIQIKCSRCKACSPKFTSEYEGEEWLSDHSCEGLRSLEQLPVELLMKIFRRELTEEQAFAALEAGAA